MNDAAPPAADAFSSVHTASFVPLLAELGASLLVTTFQAGRLILMRPTKSGINTHFFALPRPMGLAADLNRIFVGAHRSVHEYRNVPAVASRLDPPDASTIVAGNGGGPDIDCASPCTIGGSNNLVRSFGVDVTLPPGTIVGQSAQLAPLANNGGIVAGAPGDPGTGPVRTHRLYLGSPAIDQGVNNEGFNYEQRGPGYPRVVGPAADIGATEGAIQPPPQAVAAPVPALGPWMLGLLSALLAALGLARRRRTP